MRCKFRKIQHEKNQNYKTKIRKTETEVSEDI